MTKTCNHCRQAKPLVAFHKNARQIDGHHYWCGECVSASIKLRRAEKGRAPAHRRPTSVGGAHRRGAIKPQGLVERILKLLDGGPRTAAEIGDALGIAPNSARARLSRLHRRGLVNVSGVQEGRRRPSPLWTSANEF